MKNMMLSMLAGASVISISAPAFAQNIEKAGKDAQAQPLAQIEEVVVTARRREEALQDVPQTVNVVTAAEIEKLNLRSFTDLQSIIPGLTLTQQSSFNSAATVRGIAFDPAASGNNPSIEFYLNDAPISSNFLFQSMFDVGQFELQRGPQGTLRGRASPSGSMVFTTKRPDLYRMGAVLNATATDLDARKIDGAVNIPIIRDKLAVRIAGVYDDNDGTRVHSLKQAADPDRNPDPKRRTQAVRATVLFEPTDWATARLMYQDLKSRSRAYSQVQSLSLVTGATATTPIIRPFDRLSIDDQGSYNFQRQKTLVVNIDIDLAGQTLSYVGSYNKQDFNSLGTQDAGDYFAPPRFPTVARTFADPANNEAVCTEQSARDGLSPTNNNFYQCTHGVIKRESHEVRLASEERLAGMFDYVIGALYDHNETPTRLTSETPLLASPTRLVSVNLTPIIRGGESTEKSVFGNLTAHIGEALELSGGLRYIDYSGFSSILVSNRRPTPDITDKLHATIYSASAKYRFNDAVMAYATVGSSWRAGPHAVGDFSLNRSARETSFLDLPAEKSTSYEAGARTSFLEGRGVFNLSAYLQDFDNYAYRGQPIYFVNSSSIGGAPTPGVSSFNFLAAVPVRVKGIEATGSFQIRPRWSLVVNASYADGQIKDGVVACNDLNGDGKPDANPGAPTLTQLQAAVGANNLAQCSGFNSRASTSPKFNATVQSEYGFDLTSELSGFVRGLYALSGKNATDPNNDYDNVSALGLLNLYGGVRASDGRWEITLFAKNVLDKRKVISTSGAPLSNTLTTLRFSGSGQVIGSSSSTFLSEYVPVTVTPEREFGVSLRVALGSR